jgi:hypothetical protein
MMEENLTGDGWWKCHHDLSYKIPSGKECPECVREDRKIYNKGNKYDSDIASLQTENTNLKGKLSDAEKWKAICLKVHYDLDYEGNRNWFNDRVAELLKQ